MMASMDLGATDRNISNAGSYVRAGCSLSGIGERGDVVDSSAGDCVAVVAAGVLVGESLSEGEVELENDCGLLQGLLG